jgi:site-specific DNA-methyltransferase (adenine-specific)
MTVRILTGDARDVLRTLPDASVDAIVTDPPYGETNLPWDRWVDGWPAMVRRVLKPTGSMWVFGSMRMFLDHAAEFAGWKLSQDVIWEKENGSGFQNDRFRRVHETTCHFYLDDAPWAAVFRSAQVTNDAKAYTVKRKVIPAGWHNPRAGYMYKSEDGGPRLMRSVICARSERSRGVHPTQKPIDIVAPLLAYACPPGGVVLDPFAGSGTTGLCAQRAGQRAILIESNPEFITVIERRLLELDLMESVAAQ